MVEIVFGFLIRVIVFLILLPVWLVVASPVIWVMSLFGAGSYLENVRRSYRRSIDVWGEIIGGA